MDTLLLKYLKKKWHPSIGCTAHPRDAWQFGLVPGPLSWTCASPASAAGPHARYRTSPPSAGRIPAAPARGGGEPAARKWGAVGSRRPGLSCHYCCWEKGSWAKPHQCNTHKMLYRHLRYLTVLLYLFYIIFHCQTPVPILRAEVQRKKSPGGVLAPPQISRILAKHDS